ncbi:Tol-Pal system protein TolB [Candidatus Magnetomoraceae bacterium gMMP-1]
MKYKIIKICFLLLIIMVGLHVLPVQSQTVHDYINITNPFLRKIPVGVPLFRFSPDNAMSQKIADEANNLLSDTLNFTGFFKLLDKKEFLVDLQKSGITSSTIKFSNWTRIGAELLITGGLIVQNGLVVIELRMFDTFKKKLLIGKKYKGWKTDTRKIIRKFCNEIIFCLTGSKGFFDSRIAFVSTGTGTKEIYICDFDGHNPKQLTNNRSINLSPAWSSDGHWIAYTSYKDEKPDIYIQNLKDKRGTVVSFEGLNISPSWSPGRFSLAAALSKGGDSEIYLLTGKGKIIKKLTFDWGIDVSPSWAPDGKKIAFVSNRSGSVQIYIKNLETNKVRRLTFDGRYNTSPSWSPVGDRIAYSGKKKGKFNIYVINPDGTGLTQLSYEGHKNESPSWAPDGNLIAFSSDREGKQRIYIMTSYGTDQRRLLIMPGEQSNPSWSP